MSEFKDNFITLIVWQMVMLCILTDSHHIKDGELFVFVKIVEMIVFLLAPLLFWHWVDNPPQNDDE